MRRAKTVDELYAEVRSYDLVITNDAALATALNARIDRPVVGHFAMTPKQIASILGPEILGKPMVGELQAVRSIVEDTGLPFRFVHGEVSNIKEMLKHTPRAREFLYTRRSRQVMDCFEPLPTLERAMGAFDPDGSTFYREHPKIAVIGEELFNDLDKHFNTLDADPVDPFSDGEYGIETIYEIGNDRQVAENAVDLIDPARAEDFAIVLNASSPLTDAVRAALYRRGIPFVNSMNMRDLTQVRDYLRFVGLAMSYPTLRVRHVRELFSNYNAVIPAGHDMFLLSKQTDSDMSDKARRLNAAMRDITDLTFDEVVDILGNTGRSQILMLLEEMGLMGRRIDAGRVSDLMYAVDNVSELRHNEEIPLNEKTGVLIADCSRSVYVDRPVVLFLGMEQDWNNSVVGKRYLDVEEEMDLNAERLEILLQQGSRRVYCVNSTRRGRPARPSLQFDLIFRKPVERFSDICREVVRGRWCAESEGILPQRGAAEVDPEREFMEPFSKSSFNAYFSCPRNYMFKSLLHTPDRKETEFGNLLHAFAELYACYPDVVREKGVGFFADMVSDRYSGLSSPAMERIDSDRIRLGMSNIMGFLDSMGVSGIPLDVPLEMKGHPNMFMAELGLAETSSLCEMDRVAASKHMHGPFDLYWDGMVIDYKTGKASDAKRIAQQMDRVKVNRFPEFQPLMYLAIAREREKGSRGIFRLFYAMDNDVEASGGRLDLMENTRDVVCLPKDLKDIVLTDRGIRNYLSEKLSKDYRDHTDAILEVMSEMAGDDPSAWDSDEAMISRILEACGLNYNKTNVKNAKSAVRKVSGTIRNGMVASSRSLLVPESLLDDFVEWIGDMHREAGERMFTDMPATPNIECAKCEFRSVCTREIADTAGDSEGSDDSE